MTNKQIKIIKYVCSGLTALAAAIAAFFGLSSCGVTRASIVQPKDGNHSITITTNNPISTTVDNKADATYSPK